MKILPKKERKTILLLADHIEMSTGVGNICRTIVERTVGAYNWISIGGGIGREVPFDRGNYSDKYATDEVDDPRVWVYPVGAYGSASELRYVMENHNIDAIMVMGDPRYYEWLFYIEDEIDVPIIYYHVWDNLPVPKFNAKYYDSCDHVSAISKLTYGCVVNARETDVPVSYIPHGRCHKTFYPITKDLSKVDENGETDWEKMIALRDKMFGDKTYNVVFWNNKNMFRKQPGLLIQSLAKASEKLVKAGKDPIALIMRTNERSNEGQDLLTLLSDCYPNLDTWFISKPVPENQLNLYYNIADATVNVASMEGFGLTTLESLLAGTPIIVNTTGGLQDQCGFSLPSIGEPSAEDYVKMGTIKKSETAKSGEWALPISPSTSTIIGSQHQPYMKEDRLDSTQIENRVAEWFIYSSREDRKKWGVKGRTWAMENDMTADAMAASFEHLFEKVMNEYADKEERTWNIQKI